MVVLVLSFLEKVKAKARRERKVKRVVRKVVASQPRNLLLVALATPPSLCTSENSLITSMFT